MFRPTKQNGWFSMDFRGKAEDCIFTGSRKPLKLWPLSLMLKLPLHAMSLLDCLLEVNDKAVKIVNHPIEKALKLYGSFGENTRVEVVGEDVDVDILGDGEEASEDNSDGDGVGREDIQQGDDDMEAGGNLGPLHVFPLPGAGDLSAASAQLSLDIGLDTSSPSNVIDRATFLERRRTAGKASRSDHGIGNSMASLGFGVFASEGSSSPTFGSTVVPSQASGASMIVSERCFGTTSFPASTSAIPLPQASPLVFGTSILPLHGLLGSEPRVVEQARFPMEGLGGSPSRAYVSTVRQKTLLELFEMNRVSMLNGFIDFSLTMEKYLTKTREREKELASMKSMLVEKGDYILDCQAEVGHLIEQARLLGQERDRERSERERLVREVVARGEAVDRLQCELDESRSRYAEREAEIARLQGMVDGISVDFFSSQVRVVDLEGEVSAVRADRRELVGALPRLFRDFL